jgi:hypothetical protein
LLRVDLTAAFASRCRLLNAVLAESLKTELEAAA